MHEVALVAHQKLVDSLASVALNFAEPLLDVVKGFLIGDIIDYDNAMSATIVTARDGTESFLLNCGSNDWFENAPVLLCPKSAT